MQLDIAKRSLAERPQGPLGAGKSRKSHRAQAAHPVNTAVAPLHLTVPGVVLLLDETINSAIQRVADKTGMPAVAVIPAASFADCIDPVVEPGAIAGGINCARLMDKPPAVLNRYF